MQEDEIGLRKALGQSQLCTVLALWHARSASVKPPLRLRMRSNGVAEFHTLCPAAEMNLPLENRIYRSFLSSAQVYAYVISEDRKMARTPCYAYTLKMPADVRVCQRIGQATRACQGQDDVLRSDCYASAVTLRDLPIWQCGAQP